MATETASQNRNTRHVRETFPVLEMTCAACAASVESMLKSTEGVKDASVNFANHTAWVEYDAQVAGREALRNVVRSIGYDLVVDAEDPQAVQDEARAQYSRELRGNMIWSAVLAVPIVAIGMFFMDMPYGNIISLVLAAPVVFYFGRRFFINAWKQARHGKANMDTLVALSTGIAFLFSAFNTGFPEFWESRGLQPHVYFESAAVVIVFILLGKLLEERAKSGVSSAIKKLVGMQPKTARVIRNGAEQEISIAAIETGDELVVRPGGKIPVDGQVTTGSSYVNESMITGESVPAEKKPASHVFAGTVNQKGTFTFRAEKVGSQTVLAQIIRMVEQAQGSKAPVQQLVDKIAGVFVPVVMLVACITFAAWMIFGGDDAFTHALITSITVLVIACPCALGLATPTAIMVGIGKGADNNILIKDADSLERAHKVNAVVLDKTGTITEGKPLVTDLEWFGGGEASKAVLYSIQARSEHPLAEAIVSKIKTEKVDPVAIANFESLTGRGVTATVRGKSYFIGSEKLMRERAIEIGQDVSSHAISLQSQGKTVVFFSDEKALLGLIAIADKIKPTSAQAIASLQRRGVKVYMLTGDNASTAETVAREVGIQHYQAQVLPADKGAFVRSLQAKGDVVAMVGDGINDAEALAQADVSVAMGKGSDLAMDVAKITLITSDLQLLGKALNLSTKIVRGIRQNLFWAFVYNLIGIPLAAGILYPVNGFLLNPMIAGAAMALSSVSVVSNSLRLRLAKI